MNQLKYLGIASAVALLCACSGDDFVQTEKGHGRLSVSADVNTSLLTSRASRVSAENGIVSITADDLAFTLASVDGSFQKEWASLAELSHNSSVPVGEYTLAAHYGEPDAMGFEAPYFYGTADVKVRENEEAAVALTARLANSMITVVYTDALKDYLTSYSAELLCAGATAAIEYAADETRPAYVKAGNVDVYVNVAKPSGASARLLAATVAAEPQHHYLVTVDMNGGEASKGELVVTFDDDLETEEYVVDLSDELMNAPAPEVAAVGFDADPVQAVMGVPFDGTLRYEVVAKGKIAQARLSTTNASLIGDEWPEEVDLMALSAADQAKLQGLGLEAKGLWHNPDKIAIIDLAGVIGHITLPADAQDGQVKFSLTVIDKYGKASEAAQELAVNISRESLSISNPGKMYVGDATFTVEVEYNGATPEGVITFQYKNDRNTWSNLGATTFAKTGDGLYTATVPAVDTDITFTVRAVKGTGVLVSNELAITPVLSENYETTVVDAFAKKVILKVHEGDRQFAKYATAYVSTDGTDYAQAAATVDGDKLVVTGLEPSTEYYVKTSLSKSADEASEPAQFTTEAADQLPNSGMENWFRVNGQTNNWWIEYPGEDENAAWGTMNLLTTSEGGSNTGALSGNNRNGCSYNAFSGTRATTDARSGNNAAIIETVGWGKGNSATGTTASGACKKITVGELYLGSYADGPQYGYSFASRPSALQFYYKYTPKNKADYGYVEISVLDASGKVIATGSAQLTAAGAYTEKTIELDYATVAKATEIKVIFRSSGNPACQSISNDNLSSPAFGNTSTGRFVGSSLYIDDITLNY